MNRKFVITKFNGKIITTVLENEEVVELHCMNAEEEEKEALGISFRISNDCGETFSKIYKSPVSSPHGPTVLNDGTVLWVGRRLGIHNHIEAHVINTETGEMTLRGKVLPVGGIKEKILAAKRAGVTTIIISEENRKDVEDIKEIYVKGLTFVYVKNIQDVIDAAF